MTEKAQLTRSEMVRMRRRQESQNRLTQSTVLATRPLPPVTSREGRNYVAPSRVMPVPSNTRHFQASLSMPWIEVRMPAISFPHSEVKWRLLAFFISVVLGLALYFAWEAPDFRVTAARVVGNQRLPANEINAVLDTAGQPIFTLLPSDLETRLRLNYPELASARVTLGLPNTVSVQVVERQPVILWQQNNGYTWIDANGIAFRPRGAAEGLIPVAALAAPQPGVGSTQDPLSPIPFISADLVKAIKMLAPSLPKDTAMIYDPQNGLGWSDSRGWRVFFGDESKDMALKLQVYQSLVDSLTSQGIYPAFISVRYANAPYYRIGQ